MYLAQQAHYLMERWHFRFQESSIKRDHDSPITLVRYERVKFENKSLEQEYFNGMIMINKQFSIEENLITIKETNIISNYEINNKTIILK